MSLTIHFLIVVASLAGIVFIVWRKIPLLKELPEEGVASMQDALAQETKKVVSSQKEKLLRSEQFAKTLSRAKTLASATEKRTAELMGKLQKKQEERKEEFTESYWDQLRKRTKRKK
ncbi:MAG TPA: hypothetical protein VGA53_04525 [Candidatus Paceibacterota bacterium]